MVWEGEYLPSTFPRFSQAQMAALKQAAAAQLAQAASV